MIDFKSVKEAVSVKEAASFYGMKVGRNGMCLVRCRGEVRRREGEEDE
mgnify:CR=1 FL=1